MIDLRRGAAMLAMTTLTLTLVACGGGGSSGTTPSTPASTAPSDGAASVEPSAAASEDAAVSAAPSSGGGTAGGVCELITKEELVAAFGVPSVSTTELPGPPDTCVVNSDQNRPLGAWVVAPIGGGATYGALVLPGQSSDVPGLGDRAAFVDNVGLMILKGDTLLTISVAGGADLSDDEAKEVQKQLGGIAAGRL
jgi:hypothetical protein